MKAFLEKWAGEMIETSAAGDDSQAVELKPEPKPESLHYALRGKAILGEPLIQVCEVGCGAQVNFYFQDGIGYGYCVGCDVHQRIETIQ